MDIVRALHDIHKVELSRMAVLTPYSAQKEEIRKLAVQAKLLSSDHSTGLKVASITESQGKPPNCYSGRSREYYIGFVMFNRFT